MAKYNVIWQESHVRTVEATSEDEAIDLVNSGYGSDDNVEIVAGFDAYIIK